MKSFFGIQPFKKCIVKFIIGIVFSILAITFNITDPLRIIAEYQLTLSPNSVAYYLWRKPTVEIYQHVYIFNITNSEAFLNGEENLRFDEIGPYVYQEFVENEDITWNDNDTVSYIPTRKIIFRRDLSVGDTYLDTVVGPNTPLLGILSALHDAGFLVNYPIIQLANYLDSQPILHVSVHDYLWGYEDSLIELAGNIVPNYINFKKFGLLDRMYDEGVNLFNMNLKKRADTIEEWGRYLSIESINGSPGFSQWGYIDVEGNETRPENTKCNSIRGSTEGIIFPRNMDKRAIFKIYRKSFCRTIPLVYTNTVERMGLTGYQYTLAENFADPPEMNPENKCYCYKGECLKKGLMDITPCYYNIPTAASLPHFLNGDPSLLEGLDGLKPDIENHGSIIVLQPDVGIPIYIKSRLQINLIMKNTRYSSKIAAFNDRVIPLFWTEMNMPELSSDLYIVSIVVTKVLPLLHTLIVILLGFGGAVTICWSLVHFLLIVHQEQDETDKELSDLRIPLHYYSSIRILPTFARFTSKSDLFV